MSAPTPAASPDPEDASAGPGRSLRVAAVQCGSTAEPRENLAAVRAATARAAEAGAQLVVFPEATMACFGSDLRSLAQGLDGEFACGAREAAGRHGLTVVVGMFTPAPDGRVHNTLLITGPDGETRYDKIHLYDAFGSRESDLVAPGSAVVTTSIAGVRIGFATCYDLRFADQFTALGRAGAQIVAVPASWGDGPGKVEQWELLVRARAMDAQAHLIACDQAWRPPAGADPLGVGHSAVVDPLGCVLARAERDEAMLVVDLDLDRVAEVRARVPLL